MADPVVSIFAKGAIGNPSFINCMYSSTAEIKGVELTFEVVQGELADGSFNAGAILDGFSASIANGKFLAFSFNDDAIPVVEEPAPLVSFLFDSSQPAELCLKETNTTFGIDVNTAAPFEITTDCFALPAVAAIFEVSSAAYAKNGFPAVEVSMTALAENIGGLEFVYDSGEVAPMVVFADSFVTDAGLEIVESAGKVLVLSTDGSVLPTTTEPTLVFTIVFYPDTVEEVCMDDSESVVGLLQEGGESTEGAFIVDVPCAVPPSSSVRLGLMYEPVGPIVPLPTVTIRIQSDVEISGFEITYTTSPAATVADITLIDGPEMLDSFSTSLSSNTILGFSLLGAALPAQPMMTTLVALVFSGFDVTDEVCVSLEETVLTKLVEDENSVVTTALSGPACVSLVPPPEVAISLVGLGVGDLIPVPTITILFSSTVPISGFEIHYEFKPSALTVSDLTLLDGEVVTEAAFTTSLSSSVILGFSLVGGLIPPTESAAALVSLALLGGDAEEFCVLGAEEEGQTVFSKTEGEDSELATVGVVGESCIEVPQGPVVFIELAATGAGSVVPVPTVSILFSSTIEVGGFEIHFETTPPTTFTDYTVLEGQLVQNAGFSTDVSTGLILGFSLSGAVLQVTEDPEELVSLGFMPQVAQVFCLLTGDSETLFAEIDEDGISSTVEYEVVGEVCIGVPPQPAPEVLLELAAAETGSVIPLPTVTILYTAEIEVNGFEIHYEFTPGVAVEEIFLIDGQISIDADFSTSLSGGIILGFSLTGGVLPVVESEPLLELSVADGATDEFCIKTGFFETLFSELQDDGKSEPVVFGVTGSSCIDIPILADVFLSLASAPAGLLPLPTVTVNFMSEVEIGGFEIHFEFTPSVDLVNITVLEGEVVAENGFSVSLSEGVVVGFAFSGTVLPVQAQEVELISFAVAAGLPATEFCLLVGGLETVFGSIESDGTSENIPYVVVGDECIAVEDCFPLVPYSFDPNGDGDINVLDVVAMINHITGDLFTDCEFLAADGNQDGDVNVLDAVNAVGIITGSLPLP